VTSGDFDQDGFADVLALYDYGSRSAGLWVFPGTDARGDTASVPYRPWFKGPGSFDVNLTKVTAGDYNHDGADDLLALYDYSAGAAGLWVFPGATARSDTASSPYRTWYSASSDLSVTGTTTAAGDFNQDGIPDLVGLSDDGGGAGSLWVVPGTTDRAESANRPYRVWRRASTATPSFDVTRMRITAGDFNRNGITDLMGLTDYGSSAAGLWVFPGSGARGDQASRPYRVWYRGPGSFNLDVARIA
jgi:hypothetical protein